MRSLYIYLYLVWFAVDPKYADTSGWSRITSVGGGGSGGLLWTFLYLRLPLLSAFPLLPLQINAREAQQLYIFKTIRSDFILKITNILFYIGNHFTDKLLFFNFMSANERTDKNFLQKINYYFTFLIFNVSFSLF